MNCYVIAQKNEEWVPLTAGSEEECLDFFQQHALNLSDHCIVDQEEYIKLCKISPTEELDTAID